MKAKIGYLSLLPTLLLALLLPGQLWGGADTTDALQREAEAIVKQFAGTLKPRLMSAIQQGGPVNAISVCAETAPAIAQQLSDASGWQVKRVSLRARNPGATPDDWEKAMLEQFDQRRASGEAVTGIDTAETVGGSFRYLKAQAVEPLCLSCHGTSLDSAVEKALKQYYPDDRATGYQAGEVRGAFSLSRKL
ncbi:Tll0287-like domain-containing protein [Porticoccus sp.]